MTECFYDYDGLQSFGYKRKSEDKNYIGRFSLRDRGNRLEIWALSILPNYRNKGNGTRMLTEFLSQFKSDKPLLIYVLKTNKTAIHLYEKVGFTIVGECSFESAAYTMQYNIERK